MESNDVTDVLHLMKLRVALLKSLRQQMSAVVQMYCLCLVLGLMLILCMKRHGRSVITLSCERAFDFDLPLHCSIVGGFSILVAGIGKMSC